MKLGLSIGYSGAELKLPVEKVLLAERLGFDSVWTAEAYGSDAITPLAYLAALTKRIRLRRAGATNPDRGHRRCWRHRRGVSSRPVSEGSRAEPVAAADRGRTTGFRGMMPSARVAVIGPGCSTST